MLHLIVLAKMEKLTQLLRILFQSCRKSSKIALVINMTSEIIMGQRIKYLRKENNLSQDDLAVLLHVDRTTISGYVTGNRIPNIYTLIHIADIFHVSLDYLVGRFKE